MISGIPRKTLIMEFHFSKFRCCKPTTKKVPHHGSFLWSLAKFFQERHKEQLFLNSAEDIK